ncbi:hypothetical protein LEN26_016773, partial [Aphanomyces euteiches]
FFFRNHFRFLPLFRSWDAAATQVQVHHAVEAENVETPVIPAEATVVMTVIAVESLLVRGIPNSVTIDVLREKFSRRRGDIRDVYVPKDHATGEPRGFAFIEFKDIREARDKSVSYLRNNAAKLLTKCVAKNSKRVDLVANHNTINVVRVLPRVRVPRRRNIDEIEIGVAVEAVAPSADIALETNKETP